METSAVWRVLGSMRLIDVPTRWQSVRGEILPICLASLMGNATRSSLHIGNEFDREGEFVGFCGGVDIHGDEFLGFLGPDGCNRGKEVDEFFSVISLRVEEIQAVLHFFDVYGVFVGGVLEDKLFQIQEKFSCKPVSIIFLWPWT